MSILAGTKDTYKVTLSGTNVAYYSSQDNVFPVGRITRVDLQANITAASPAFIEIFESGTSQVVLRDFGTTSGASPSVFYPSVLKSDTEIGVQVGSVPVDILVFGNLGFRISGGNFNSGSNATFTVFWER